MAVRLRKGMRVRSRESTFQKEVGVLERRLKNGDWLVRFSYTGGPPRFLKFRYKSWELRKVY